MAKRLGKGAGLEGITKKKMGVYAKPGRKVGGDGDGDGKRQWARVVPGKEASEAGRAGAALEEQGRCRWAWAPREKAGLSLTAIPWCGVCPHSTHTQRGGLVPLPLHTAIPFPPLLSWRCTRQFHSRFLLSNKNPKKARLAFFGTLVDQPMNQGRNKEGTRTEGKKKKIPASFNARSIKFASGDPGRSERSPAGEAGKERPSGR